MPSYVSEYEKLKEKGVDEIICLAVNDPYVMSAWGDQLQATNKIRMLSDPKAEFTKAAGLEMDLVADLGNVRCKRFSLCAEDGVIKALNIEPDGQGTTCSKVDNILQQCAKNC